MQVFLDNASTTKISKETKDYLRSILDDYYGNPSSSHSEGIKSRKIIDETRKIVSDFINASDESDILFTPSGSASNTLGISGYYRKHNCTLLYSPTAHKSILKCVADYKYGYYPLKVDNKGFIDISDLKEWLDARQVNPFVVLEYANSEIGTIQDIKKIIDLIHFYNGIVYLDCTGSISQIPLNVKYLNVDIAGFSGHKIGALKGVSVLYKKKNIELSPIIYGAQENGLCAGTENILGLASIGCAIRQLNYSSILQKNRDYVWEYIQKNIPDSYLVGAMADSGNRLPYNLYVCFKDISGESLAILLDLKCIQVSTGSACSSGDLTPSPTLSAIGIDRRDINSCIRMSFNGEETDEQLDYVCRNLKECVDQLRLFANR